MLLNVFWKFIFFFRSHVSQFCSFHVNWFLISSLVDSLEEKVMIKRAMAREFMGSGHWYKCMNGKSTKE
jgi:hypothetical protein